jgi:hypothetical protein
MSNSLLKQEMLMIRTNVCAVPTAKGDQEGRFFEYCNWSPRGEVT